VLFLLWLFWGRFFGFLPGVNWANEIAFAVR
jgi:hypothetical protein